VGGSHVDDQTVTYSPSLALEWASRRRPRLMADRTTHIFRVSLQGDPSIYREIEITSTTSLYRFAAAIVAAFGFDFDHAFGFYAKLTGRNILRSEPRYELFRDMGESTDSLSVRKTKLDDAFEVPGHKMLFVFDYGDDWRFVVELLSVSLAKKGTRYPRVVTQKGAAPEQYPDPDRTVH
jgi:hypothetical protein